MSYPNPFEADKIFYDHHSFKISDAVISFDENGDPVWLKSREHIYEIFDDDHLDKFEELRFTDPEVFYQKY